MHATSWLAPARSSASANSRSLHKIHAGRLQGSIPAGRAWLLTGPTGSGKSTLAYALARKGWPILGDDGVITEVVTEAGRTGPVIAYRWREPLRVSKGLISEFPELVAGTRHARMLPNDPRQRAEVPVRGTRSAPVAALVWVEQGPIDAITPLAPAAALVELVQQSAWVLIADGGSPAHLAALRHIAIDVPSFRLVHSPAQLQCIDHTLASVLP